MIRRARFIIQMLFFFLAVAIFLGKLPEVAQAFAAIHVFPRISLFSHLLIPPLVVVTLITLVSIPLLGRWYCSFVCPAGFIQDLSAAVAAKASLWNLRSSPKILFVRGLLLGSVLCTVLMALPWYGIIDHFTNFGRLVALVSGAATSATALILSFAALIIIAPLVFPRLFCNLLCPTGILYALLGWKALIRPKATGVCSLCRECRIHCPALCIHEGRIDRSQCIGCFECLENCPSGVFTLKNAGGPTSSGGRREFLSSASALLIGGGAAGALRTHSILSPNRPEGIPPPGAMSLENFASRCIGCGICTAVCPSKVLEPRQTGILPTPFMNYFHSYCSYGCNACLAVCPSGAISYLPLPQKKLAKIGEAYIHEDRCIPFVSKKECLACAEYCPTGAISLEPRGEIRVPKLNPDYCIGCGACQYICPALPDRAALVRPLSVHKIASPPRRSPVENQNERLGRAESAFPF